MTFPNEVSTSILWSDLWLRGGFPESTLAVNDADSFDWRLDFIRTFMETVNYHKLAAAADISIPTLKKYLAILEQTYMLRLLLPAETNLKKRLIKSPKVYLRDSGILHALLGIETYDNLLAHPIAGASWEGFVIENIIACHNRWKPSFMRTVCGENI